MGEAWNGLVGAAFGGYPCDGTLLGPEETNHTRGFRGDGLVFLDDPCLGSRRCPVVGARITGSGVGCVLFENCIVDASIFFVWCFFGFCGQVAEGRRWMPWHQEPMKDVGGRDSPGGVVNQAVIPGCPNGVTRRQSCGVTCT
jgi:hypothetical protein